MLVGTGYKWRLAATPLAQRPGVAAKSDNNREYQHWGWIEPLWIILASVDALRLLKKLSWGARSESG